MITPLAITCLVTACLAGGLTLVFCRRRCSLLRQRIVAAQRIVEMGNDPILVADIVDGRVLLANDAMCTLLDYQHDVLCRRRLPQLHPPALVQLSAQRIAEIWEEKGMVYADMPLVRRNGEEIAVEISARVLSFQGRPAVVLYARDIRQRLRREQRIRDYASELEQVNRELREMQSQLVQSAKMAALGGLVAGVAHEINTPLGAIRANTNLGTRALAVIEDLIQVDDSREGRLHRALQSMRQVCETTGLAAHRMDHIVRSLRNFARLDEAELKEVDLHEGLDSTLDLLQHQLDNRITVQKDYGKLPRVRCRANLINQVFINVLQNAIAAIAGQGQIRITTRAEDDQVTVEVADTGIGIHPEQLERIFDPGYTTKGVGVGTGLGLAISYRIVEQHQGRIDVTSRPNEGATFTIRLPVQPEQPLPAGAEP